MAKLTASVAPAGLRVRIYRQRRRATRIPERVRQSWISRRVASEDRSAIELYRKTGATIAQGAIVPPGSRVTAGTTIGHDTGFMGPVFIEGDSVATFGCWGAIGHNLRVVTSQHDLTRANMHMDLQVRLGLPTYYTASGPVDVGPAVWIGDSVTILGDVAIGPGAVIGTGSLVTKSVPPFAIAFGVPAVVQRLRFSEDIVRALLEIAWWDWSDERVLRNVEFFRLELTNSTVSDIMKVIVD